MIYYGQNPPTSLPHYDLCVIGTGASGQTLLHEFQQSSYRIAFIESGGSEPDTNTEQLKNIHTPNLPVAFTSRERYLGGTTNTWQSVCMTLDDIDFQNRKWVLNSGWGFQKQELHSFYYRATDFLSIPSLTHQHQVIGAQKATNHSLDNPYFSTTFNVKTKNMAGFSQQFYTYLANSEKHDLFLFSNVVSIKQNEMANHVFQIKIQAIGKMPFLLSASYYVLACGGIENARLLLISNVGNTSGKVGNFFMDHLKGESSKIIPHGRMSHFSPYLPFVYEEVRYRCGLRLTSSAQKKHQTLNSSIQLIPHYQNSFWRKRKAIAYFSLKHFHEMSPNAGNKITLSSEKDALDCPQAILDYQLSNIDKHTFVVFHKLLKQYIEAIKFGTVKSDLEHNFDSWMPLNDASHHMGTTRMGHDPKQSVVNLDSRLHDVDNLFIAGSSIFPTSGHANPTLTIIALTMRLADHLKKLL